MSFEERLKQKAKTEYTIYSLLKNWKEKASLDSTTKRIIFLDDVLAIVKEEVEHYETQLKLAVSEVADLNIKNQEEKQKLTCKNCGWTIQRVKCPACGKNMIFREALK